MREEDARLVRSSLSSVAPYIAYPQELTELVERELKGSDSIEAFVDNVKRVVSERTDVTKKTDGQIFLNELRHRVQK